MSDKRTSNKNIILIGGRAQAGKDTVANFLKDKLLGRTLIIHNADYLKYICKQYYGWDGQKSDKGRSVLQYIGTALVRQKKDMATYWVERTCDIIKIFWDRYDYFIVPDLRFLNEVYYTKSRFPYNVMTVKIVRPNFDNGLTEEQKNHLSEVDLDGFEFDATIMSNSGIDRLERAVENFMEKYGYVYKTFGEFYHKW
jgi:hypothetical protein